jgi:hypothetical protein
MMRIGPFGQAGACAMAGAARQSPDRLAITARRWNMAASRSFGVLQRVMTQNTRLPLT